MTLLGVHLSRLEGLIENGLSDDELRQFFKTSQKRLLLAGVRVQSLPRSKQEAVKFILHFSKKAHDVLGDWLSKQSHTYPEELKGQLTARFRAIEREGVEFSEDATLNLFRCGLDALYSESPPPAWSKFLATDPEGEEPSPDVDTTSVEDDRGRPSPVSARAIEQYAQWVAGELESVSISEPTLQLAAKLADGIRSGNEQLIEELPPDPSAYPILRRLISAVNPKEPTLPSGVHAFIPPTGTFDSERNYLVLEIIATAFRNAGNNPYFLDVEAFLDGDKAFTLDIADLRDVIPDEGRIIHFGDSRFPPVIFGQPACYRVERFDTSKPIKVRVVGTGRHLVPIKYVPHLSSDHDLVRRWILAYAEAYQSNRAVFVTNDGLCFAPRVDSLKRILAADYDWTLDAWPSIDALELKSGAFVPAPLPASMTHYDCAPLTYVARRLLRRLADSAILKLTKQQILDVAEKLGDEESDLDAARRDRVRSQLHLLAQSDTAYEQLVAELMTSPSVRQDIETRKQQQVADAASALASERKALENLKKEKASLERKLTQLQREVEDHAKDVRTAVRKAFDTAKSKEGETLGQLALWQTLLQGRSGTGERRSATVQAPQVTSTPPAERLVTNKYPGGEALEDALVASGFSEDMARLYRAVLKAAAGLGVPVTVTGPGSASLALRLARSLSDGETLCIDVPVGLVTDALKPEMFDGTGAGAVIIRNANLSDLSAYGQKLLDHIAERIFEPPPRSPQCVIVFAGASGPAALPWPDEIRFLSAKLDLTGPLRKGDLTILGALSDDPAPLQQKLRRRVQLASEAGTSDAEAYALLMQLIQQTEA